jgi:hypothetical protein
LFVIRKVGQRKHFPVKEKFGLVSRKSFSKLSCICLPLEKLVNGKHFPVKEKIGLVSGKYFPRKFGRKTLSGSCEKFRNVITC